jgi:hypothetical protein
VSLTAVVLVAGPMGLLTNSIVFAAVWAVAAALIGFVVVNLQHLAAIAVPDNRGGALSSVLSFRFMGHALGPLLWVPIFDVSPAWAFAGSALLGLATVVAFRAATRPDQPTRSSTDAR